MEVVVSCMPTSAVPKASPAPLPELTTSLRPSRALFRRSTSRASVERSLTGLLTDLPRKNCDTIAAAVAGTSTERLQHLLTDATWESSGPRPATRAHPRRPESAPGPPGPRRHRAAQARTRLGRRGPSVLRAHSARSPIVKAVCGQGRPRSPAGAQTAGNPSPGASTTMWSSANSAWPCGCTGPPAEPNAPPAIPASARAQRASCSANALCRANAAISRGTLATCRWTRRCTGWPSWRTAAGLSSRSTRTLRASVDWMNQGRGWDGLHRNLAPVMLAYSFLAGQRWTPTATAGFFPRRGAAVVPGGPSPGAPVALPRCGIMAHLDESV